MSKDFESYLERKDLEEQEAVALALSKYEEEDIDIFSSESDGETIAIDLRSEIHAQIALLKAIRSHLFSRNGKPKDDTDPSSITSYMNSSMKLLGMLQSFESSLKTDQEVRKIEMALEMAMEDCPCPEFVAKLTEYLEGSLI